MIFIKAVFKAMYPGLISDSLDKLGFEIEIKNKYSAVV
jgi:hypothetical protein